MTELEEALLKAFEKQGDELKSVHERIEKQQGEIDQLTELLNALTTLSISVSEQLNSLRLESKR